MSPDLTKVLAVATPLIMQFAAEVLAAMRDEGSMH